MFKWLKAFLKKPTIEKIDRQDQITVVVGGKEVPLVMPEEQELVVTKEGFQIRPKPNKIDEMKKKLENYKDVKMENIFVD